MVKNVTPNAEPESEVRTNEPCRLLIYLALNGRPEIRNSDTGAYERTMDNQQFPFVQVSVEIGAKEAALLQEIWLGRYAEFVALEVQNGESKADIEFFRPTRGSS